LAATLESILEQAGKKKELFGGFKIDSLDPPKEEEVEARYKEVKNWLKKFEKGKEGLDLIVSLLIKSF
jgi:hypothetical protein